LRRADLVALQDVEPLDDEHVGRRTHDTLPGDDVVRDRCEYIGAWTDERPDFTSAMNLMSARRS
jgi:hypothetical protein